MSLRDDLQHALGAAFTVERELGGGGMAELFVANDNTLNRRVVVKVVSAGAGHRLSIERFRREVALAASLQHPHIVSVLGAGDVTGLPYFLMPFVEGESLRRRLDTDGMLPVRESVGILRDVARACAYAHERGVIHRDIKPDNVLLAKGSAMIADFGIAKAIASADVSTPNSGQTLTQEGISIGTPGYMAPEQVAGDPSTDHRADIYAIGVMAYEMLTGKTPFHDKTPHELLTAKLTQPAPPITGSRTDIPPGFARLIMQCLEQEPAKRPQTAADLIQALDDPAVVSGSQEVRIPRRRVGAPLVGAALVGAALVAALVFAVKTRGNASEAPRSVAVVPLANVGGDSSTAYLAEGLTDEITLALARLPGLRVAARSAMATYRGANRPAPEIGRELGVATVLEGSIQVAGGRLRLMAQLTDVRDGLSLWSQRFEGSMRDVFALQDSLANAVAEALRSRFGGAPVATARGAVGTSDVVAYDLFLRGRFLFRQRGTGHLREAINLLEQAVARDSGFARAWATLADAWAVLPLYGGADPDTAREKALGYVEQALVIDSTLGDALASRGNLNMGMWRWEEAEEDLRRATVLDSSSVNAWQWYGEWLLYNGRNAEAEAALARAVTLDPASPALIAIHGVMLMAAGRATEAIAETQRSMSIDSASVVARMMHGLVLACAGRNADAVRVFEAVRRLAGDAPPIMGMLGYTWARAGQRPKAEALRDSLMRAATAPGVTGILAHTMLGLGDSAQALTWLEWSASAHDPIFVSVPFACPMWDPVRSSARFTSVMRRVGLTE